VSRSIRKRFATGGRATLALAALLGVLMSATAADARRDEQQRPDGEPAERWTRTLALDLKARDLGLPAGASAQRLAKAALESRKGRIGLRGSIRGLRIESRLRTPAADGTRALTRLRFQQTAGSLRVVWSQIDVTVVAGKVSSIGATVVPVSHGRPAGERRVSRKRALRIALRAVAGASEALDPLPAAYAGAPTARVNAKPRTARRAWVVEVQPPAAPDEEVPTPLCIVVDAETGNVIGRWPGMADRPDRGPQARGAEAADAGRIRSDGATARGAQVNPTQFLLDVYDGTNAVPGNSDPFDGTTAYSSFRIAGDPHVGANWPRFDERCVRRSDPPPCVTFFAAGNGVLDAVGANAENVARTICTLRDYCGRLGGLMGDSGNYAPWRVIGNANRSHAYIDELAVEIAAGHEMDGDGDPTSPFNDIVAHEFGHVRDWVYAGDRFVGGVTHEALEAQEGLADMFAYDYDQGDATIGEEATNVLIRDWANPGAQRLGSRPYPAHMDDYDDTPFPNEPPPQFNSTILSHAYYRFVQRVRHDRAGRVLHTVPQRLSPRPTFEEVARAFCLSGFALYGRDVSNAALAAFHEVGLLRGTLGCRSFTRRAGGP
jgi:Zn-dependent metalloprotease